MSNSYSANNDTGNINSDLIIFDNQSNANLNSPTTANNTNNNDNNNNNNNNNNIVNDDNDNDNNNNDDNNNNNNINNNNDSNNNNTISCDNINVNINIKDKIDNDSSCYSYPSLSSDIHDHIDVIFHRNLTKRATNSNGFIATLIHLIKANIGVGMLAMANATSNAGYIVGPVFIIIMGLIATHCMNLLVGCGQHLCARLSICALEYSDIADISFSIATNKRIVGNIARLCVNIMLVITQLGFCCTYLLFILENTNKILISSGSEAFSIYLLMLIFLPLVILCSYIRSFKKLVPLSSVANICFLYGIVICMFYAILVIFQNNWHFGQGVTTFSHSLIGYPLFFSNVIFSYEGIGCVLPLENKIAKPSQFSTVVWTAMAIVISLYLAVGLTGYLAFGSSVESVISLNLPIIITEPWMAIFPTVFVVLAVGLFFSYFVQFYVPMEILEPLFLRYFHRDYTKLFSQLLFRSLIVILTAIVAVTVPKLNLLIDLIGASSSSFLALVFPPLLEIATFYRCKRYMLPFKVWIIKNILIIVIGLVGSVLGTGVTIYKIILQFESGTSNTN